VDAGLLLQLVHGVNAVCRVVAGSKPTVNGCISVRRIIARALPSRVNFRQRCLVE